MYEEGFSPRIDSAVKSRVVDDDGKLDGIISIGDVVKARVGQLETENNQLHDYIQAR